jgi:hypothetical protein
MEDRITYKVKFGVAEISLWLSTVQYRIRQYLTNKDDCFPRCWNLRVLHFGSSYVRSDLFAMFVLHKPLLLPKSDASKTKMLLRSSQKPQEALNLLVTEERYWTLFYMPQYKFLHNSLNVLIQIANKMGLQNKKKLINGSKYCTFASCRTLLLHFHFSFRLLCGLSMFLIHF